MALQYRPLIANSPFSLLLVPGSPLATLAGLKEGVGQFVEGLDRLRFREGLALLLLTSRVLAVLDLHSDAGGGIARLREPEHLGICAQCQSWLATVLRPVAI